MAKLKKTNIKIIICPTCKGNGFVKVASFHSDSMIHQCWDCDSEGEFYETTDNLIGDPDSDHNNNIKLH